MPATSLAQYRAMQAAAHGKSTLGIPAKVGKEFAAATDVEQLTGMKMGKKRTRRGKRKGKGQSAEHMQHMAEMRRCVECQDHKGAKNAAFKFIKSLPADDMEMEHGVMEERAEKKTDVSRSTSSKGSLSPGLRAFLAKKKAK